MSQAQEVERIPGTATGDSEFVQFWNEVLAPKFTRFRHILVGGLTRHSEAVFPKLPVREGDRVVDVGCGWGDTAMALARLVGPRGSVVGIDCCDRFLETARQELAESGLQNITFQPIGGQLLPGLARVVARISAEAHPLGIQNFFLLPNDDLRDGNSKAMSPRDWLITGGDPEVVAQMAADL